MVPFIEWARLLGKLEYDDFDVIGVERIGKGSSANGYSRLDRCCKCGRVMRCRGIKCGEQAQVKREHQSLSLQAEVQKSVQIVSSPRQDGAGKRCRSEGSGDKVRGNWESGQERGVPQWQRWRSQQVALN